MSKKNRDFGAVPEIEEMLKDDSQESAMDVLESVEAETETTATAEEPVIYLGPTVYGIATKGTIYNNGLPLELTNAIAKNPTIGALVVKISEANFVRTEIRKTGSAYNLYYNSIKK